LIEHNPGCSSRQAIYLNEMSPSRFALIVLPQGFEEVEAVTPIDLLRRAGVSVTIASLDDRLEVTGRNGIAVLADAPLEVPFSRSYDMVILPGGPGVKHLRADPRIVDLVKTQAARGAWVAAICAAPTVLHDAGLLKDRRYTAHPSVAGELRAILEYERVVVDAPIITSRGAGTALDFGLELVARLVSPEAAQEVRASICG
jgi:4-methyl-5(b-hydroxyethyl)-thiazole monophosphate biosynthesis